MKDYLYIDSSDDSHQAKFKVSNTPKIDYLINEKRFDEALIEINKILESDDDHDNWNLKGIILDKLGEYEESIDCFNKALSLDDSSETQLNKANAIYDWAKVTFFPEGNNDKALKLINQAIECLPESEDPSEYYFLKAEILEGMDDLVESHKNYLIAYKEFDRLNEFERQVQYLENTDDTVFVITGCSFYNFTPEPDMTVGLVKDDENEHDSDAVAVMFDDKIIGYVANSSYTLIEDVKSASEIRNLIDENSSGVILFTYLGEYVITKLIFS